MVVTPYFFKYNLGIYRLFTRLGISHKSLTPRRVKELHKEPGKRLENHVTVFGAGVTGMGIIHELRERKQKFVVLDHDPDVMKKLSRMGVYCFYGEADNEEILHNMGLFKAKMAVITIPDMDEACFVVKKAKRFNPKINIVARASTEREEAELRQAGADHIMVPKIICAHELVRGLRHYLKK